ncbi:MAG TPA: YidC/Oxa1 family membrane protein insertase, partial [Acidimicrobiales bacterium]|nr:YidC/Oxa1 family membrane protein insertase [Acidimicrobiales bacterium]
MFDALAGLMAWFYELWPSYGGAIILLTLTVMLVLTPLTLRGTRSMLRMQRLQPEMKRIQKEF